MLARRVDAGRLKCEEAEGGRGVSTDRVSSKTAVPTSHGGAVRGPGRALEVARRPAGGNIAPFSILHGPLKYSIIATPRDALTHAPPPASTAARSTSSLPAPLDAADRSVTGRRKSTPLVS